ncbi:putative bifunctional diguanylate cyclase/phosphodiesterase [Pseudomonas sp. 32A]|uniref:putative bifunctional diguanylate cyclase/phosphodiesterase n=1 Tax=Pseudomonas sp. 32A TaxID=651185 RepID=UPI0040456277
MPHILNEEQRLSTLAEYRIWDTPQSGDFDRLARLASSLFNVPIVLISLVGRDRQFIKARVGIDICETSREVSFCAHAILQDDILFVPDALNDPRFSSNPLVLGPPFIRFYAGKPLVTSNGHSLGTICLIDSEPRMTFGEEDRKNISDLAELVMDRMEMRRLEYAKTVSLARFENIAGTSPDAIICSDVEGKITFWNRSAEKLFGYLASEIADKSGAIVIPESWRAIYDAEMVRLRTGEKMELANQTVELSGLHKDGSEFPAEFSLSTWGEGDKVSVGAIVRDITERRQNEERLFRLASLDPLTDLPNRSAWRAALTATLHAGESATVILFDLDGFKEVNDTLGHSAGDAVLKDVASRMKSVCKKPLMLGRLGGDEFVVLMAGDNVRAARALAEQLVLAISKPYEFAGQSISTGVSIGVSFAPIHGSRPEDLLGAADLALYKAKAAGKGRYELFIPAFRDVAIARRIFERELQLAFENDEFELFYQPQIATGTRKLTGAEALMRWRHPSRGLLSPASFIDVLGDKPIAAAVGEWALRTACKQAVTWRVDDPTFRIGVNLFDAQLRSGRLLAVVRDVLAESGLPPEALELEIVENILLRRDKITVRLLNGLRELGVGLAFDDYGTGFASLSLLKQYPVTRLKIDRSFIRELNINQGDAAVVKAVIYLGKSFGLGVIAEGVETEAQLDFLTANECFEAQGYLFGKPVPSSEFSDRFICRKPTTSRE